MLVVEDYIILDEHVFKLSLVQQKIPCAGVFCTVTSSVIMTFGDIETFSVDVLFLTDPLADEVEQPFEVYTPCACEAFIYLCVISSVDKYADRSVVCVHGGLIQFHFFDKMTCPGHLVDCK